MNMYFGDQLRRELVELILNAELPRSCAQSTGSHRLSSDSRTGEANIICQDVSPEFLQWTDYVVRE